MENIATIPLFRTLVLPVQATPPAATGKQPLPSHRWATYDTYAEAYEDSRPLVSGYQIATWKNPDSGKFHVTAPGASARKGKAA